MTLLEGCPGFCFGCADLVKECVYDEKEKSFYSGQRGTILANCHKPCSLVRLTYAKNPKIVGEFGGT